MQNQEHSFVTTDPAPIKEYFPIVFPQIIVALAPIDADFFTNVFYKILNLFEEIQI